MITESWKDVSGYEGFYQVSNTGKVKSLERTCTTANGRLRTVSEKMRATCISNIGYELVTLYKNGGSHTHKVHRLVATEFLPNASGYDQVNHKDGNKLNNRYDNLEWCNAQQNVEHAERTGLRHSKGEGNNFFGKRHSEETKEKLRLQNGIMIVDTETGIFYNSITEAAMVHSINPITLQARINRYKSEKRFVKI